MREVTLNYNQVISHCKSEKKKKNQSFSLITIEVKQRKKPGGSNCSSEAIRAKYRIISKMKHSYSLCLTHSVASVQNHFYGVRASTLGQKHDHIRLPRPPFQKFSTKQTLPKHSIMSERQGQHSQLQYPTSLEMWETPSLTVSTVCGKITT